MNLADHICVCTLNLSIHSRAPFYQARGRGSQRGPRGRRMPDHKVHPDKWTMYSLEDIDTSDSSNKQAALEFLNVSTTSLY